jgi:phosphatidylglycerol---prolipoprotein diacylglyceryl transferase
VIPYFELPTFSLGFIDFEPFGILVALGFLLGTSLAARRARQIGLAEYPFYDIGLIAVIVGLTSAHLAVVFFSNPQKLLERPIWILEVWSGISSYGGFIGAGVAIAIYLKRKKLDFLPYADALMFGLLPGWLLGRLGCTVVHDHPGRLSNFFLAVKYPAGARHNLGLYEVIWCLVFIPLIYWMGRKKKVEDPIPGSIYVFCLISYSIIRFFLDFLRARDLAIADPTYLGLIPPQWFSVACAVLGFYMWRKIRQSEPQHVAGSEKYESSSG